MHICTEAENIFQTSVYSVDLVILIRLMGLCISVFADWVKVTQGWKLWSADYQTAIYNILSTEVG